MSTFNTALKVDIGWVYILPKIAMEVDIRFNCIESWHKMNWIYTLSKIAMKVDIILINVYFQNCSEILHLEFTFNNWNAVSLRFSSERPLDPVL